MALTGQGAGSFLYDGNLKRAKQTVGGKTTYSIYSLDGQLLFRDAATDGVKTDYISVAGESVARVANGTVTYPYQDHLGTALMVADASGQVPAGSKFRYSPFGEELTGSAANDNQPGYTGHVEDASGLTYMQARYYDPSAAALGPMAAGSELGRFLSNDLVGFSPDKPFMFNRYAYVENDPINRWDPFGLCAVEDGKITQCDVVIEDGVSQEEADAVIDAFVQVGTAIQENGSADQQNAWSEVSEIRITTEDSDANPGASAENALTTDSRTGELVDSQITVFRPGLGRSENETIEIAGHEIWHGTRSNLASGPLMKEHDAKLRSTAFLKKHGVLPSDYTPKAYPGLPF